MKNVVPLIALIVFFILLVLVIAVTFPKPPAETGQPSSQLLCTSGDKRPCTSGSCEGTATCINSVWSGCKWEQVCSPGFREPCVSMGCAYAVKECNECGTGWGECLPLNSS